MSQVRKAEGQIEIKSCANKFFDVWAHKPHHVSEMCPDKYPKIELHEGDWHSVGSVMTWNYVAYGKSEFVKTKVENIDESSMSVTYNLIDGHIVKTCYKNFKSKIQIIPRGENCIVKWSFDYEKRSEDAPDAEIFVDFLLGVAKDMDAHICNT